MKNKTQRDKELRVLADFIVIYCRERHRGADKPAVPYPKLAGLLKPGDTLCAECTRLLAYGMGKLMQCPHDPKPMCKKCKVVRRRGVIFVICENPKHKQRQG
mgnify:CR=1 FL=1